MGGVRDLFRDLFRLRKRAKTTAYVDAFEKRQRDEIARNVGPLVRGLRWCGRMIGLGSMAAVKRVKPRGPGATQALHKTPNRNLSGRRRA